MAAATANPKKAFTACYRAFASALRSTFPELGPQIATAESQIAVGMHLPKFWTMVRGLGDRIAATDSTLLRDPEFHVLPGVSLAPVWDEDLSDETRSAIWKYLLNLYKLAEIIRVAAVAVAPETPTDASTPDTADATADDFLKDDEDELGGLASLLDMGADMSNNLTKLQEVFANVAKLATGTATDASGETPAFTIPDELKDSTLFKLVQDLVSDLNPRDLGLDPAEVDGMSPENALAKIVEMYEKNPEKIIGLVKRIGTKLQSRIQSGSLTQDALIDDSKKFIAFLESNETLRAIAEPLKEVFESMSAQFAKMTGRGARGRPGGVAGATTVRDRLRRNAERRAAAAAATATTAPTAEQQATAAKSVEELAREIDGTGTATPIKRSKNVHKK